MSQIKIGKIISTFGIKGELKVYPYGDSIESIKTYTIKNNNYEVEKIRKQKNIYIVKLKDYDDINQVEKFRDEEIIIDEKDLPKLDEDKYYIDDLIGLDVYTDDNNYLGKIEKVYKSKANDIYEVGKLLLPAIKDVIKSVDLENKKMIVHLIDGLKEINN